MKSRNLKKIMGVLLAASMIAASFSGCGRKGESGDASADNSTSTDKTNTGDSKSKKFDCTLKVIGIDNVVAQTVLDHADELEEELGIKIEFQQYSNEQASNKIAVSMAAGGTDVDVMMIRPLDETLLYSQNGWLENLQPYIERDSEVDYNDFMEACRDVCTNKDGDAVCLPAMTESGVIYYNKTMFKEAGITELPTTMEELYEAAGKLDDPVNDICGFACRGMGNPSVTQFSCFLRAFGADFFDKDGNAAINTPEALEAFQFYGKLLRDYGPDGVLNMTWTETWNLFTQGKAAMRLDANTNLGSWNEDDSAINLDEIGFFDVPVGPNGDYGNYYITAWAYGISYGSQNKEAAWEFIKWATSKEMQNDAQKNGNSGARLSVWEGDYSPWPEEVQKLAAEAGPKSYGSERPYMINVSRARDLIGEAVTKAIEGVDDDELQKLLDKKNADLQKLLDSEKTP
ncbi:sugar ABC transporter substrate-binding protein [Muricomes intestini]|uniref:ABC transporter substrate-binding protein n=1 Tax=Muricomes intestini TaxID=1796634 RepID=UPI002FE0DB83